MFLFVSIRTSCHHNYEIYMSEQRSEEWPNLLFQKFMYHNLVFTFCKFELGGKYPHKMSFFFKHSLVFYLFYFLHLSILFLILLPSFVYMHIYLFTSIIICSLDLLMSKFTIFLSQLPLSHQIPFNIPHPTRHHSSCETDLSLSLPISHKTPFHLLPNPTLSVLLCNVINFLSPIPFSHQLPFCYHPPPSPHE